MKAWNDEKPFVTPVHPQPDGGTPYSKHLTLGRMQFAALPARDRALGHAGKFGKIRLLLLEDASPDVMNGFHNEYLFDFALTFKRDIRFGMRDRMVKGAMIDFAKEIKSIRQALAMSQAEFAEAIGASQGSVSKWEKGREVPRTKAWMNIRALYESYEAHALATTFDPYFAETLNREGLPETADALIASMLNVPTTVDVFVEDFQPLMVLRLPRSPKINGKVLGWIAPALGSIREPDDAPPGTVIFCDHVSDYEPRSGERVIVQISGQGSSANPKERFLYRLVYYGRSDDRGLEWFTDTEKDSAQVRVAESHSQKTRRESIKIVGPLLAMLRWESHSMRVLSKMGKDDEPF